LDENKMDEDKTIINTDSLTQIIKNLDGWELKRNKVLERKFTFDNFKEITKFLNHLVTLITELNHHPDFSLNTGSRTVFVSLTTHSEDCITQADLDFASELNKWPTDA
jgi:pterin-4a-carbinolamine dehydratase